MIDPALKTVRDRQTITPEGERLEPWIDGVVLHRLRLIEDERGAVLEMYRPAWGLSDDPLVYVYEVSVRPGATKGWVVHASQADRIVNTRGTLRWALYDARTESPTFRAVNDFVTSDQNRSLLIIPAGVFHAVRNIETGPATFINMPTRPYDHAHPDKQRLPVDGVSIPFTFDAATPPSRRG